MRSAVPTRFLVTTAFMVLAGATALSAQQIMAQLNRAASNYSPRLLPGLISSKSHQFVLGIFLGTITFCLIVLITIEPSDDSYELPGLAILSAVALSIACLGIFVYFIHTISEAIQITNILERVAGATCRRLDELSQDEERSRNQDEPNRTFNGTIKAIETGYFHDCNEEMLLNLAVKHDLVLEVIPHQGTFVLENTNLINYTGEISESLESDLLSCIFFTGNRLVRENYVFGFKQITEIAVRAMSPGTNDPGTALTAIDHLTHLFARRLRIDDRQIISDKNGAPRVFVSVTTFQNLLYLLNAPLRQYCKHDVVIVLKLLQMFHYLLQQPGIKKNHKLAIEEEIDNLLIDSRVETVTISKAFSNLPLFHLPKICNRLESPFHFTQSFPADPSILFEMSCRLQAIFEEEEFG